MLTFDEAFYEDEVREGFYVPSMMKRCWAVQLEVLYNFHNLCEKYHIQYFADWGTLLAAVRHRGMIPWDDDIDVVMHRNEFEKFMELASKELPEGYHFTRFETSETCWQFIINLTSYSKMNFSKEYMDRYKGFPYMAGLDIFIMDNFCPDEAEADKWRENLKRILTTADMIWEDTFERNRIELLLREIEKENDVKLMRNGSLHDRRMELYLLAKKVCGRYNNQDTEYISQMLPGGIFHNVKRLKSDYGESINLPFENIEISVPILFHKLLYSKYRQYYKVVKTGIAAHNYPYYEDQRKALGQDIDFVANYKYEFKVDIKPEERVPLLRQCSEEYKNHFAELAEMYDNIVNGHKSPENCINIELLGQWQENAINYGNYIEEVRGSDCPIIVNIEKYCESLYNLSMKIDFLQQGGQTENSVLDETAALINECISMKKILDELVEGIDEYILNRKTIVFMSYKPENWHYMEKLWRAAVDKPENDVIVVSVPYYYKKYDGTIIKQVRGVTGYPDYVSVIDGLDIDMEALEADVIYIQNPYDEYNMATSVYKEFYSTSLKSKCSELIYAPYFREADFGEVDVKEYYNMRFYCDMPGVVNADKIILASDMLKDMYVKRLCQFAGQDTYEQWKNKIEVAPFVYENEVKVLTIPEELRGLEKYPRRMVYFISISNLYEQGQVAVKKHLNNIETLGKAGDEMGIVFCTDCDIKKELLKCDISLAEEYDKIIEATKEKENIVIYSGDTKQLPSLCVGYYGDVSSVMRQFVVAGKPVMLNNYIVLG